MSVSIVIPTIGRPSLQRLLESLDVARGPRPVEILVVDDRPGPVRPLPHTNGWTAERSRTLRSGGRGPAAARNVGWRTARGDWIAFLDDDVLVGASWLEQLAADLERAEDDGAVGSQGRLCVPAPEGRAPTDWERGTLALAHSRWITADMAYRRSSLLSVGGFDERFTRAFREDADLALRLVRRGQRIDMGIRSSKHPVRPSRWRASISAQRGNSDDALMRTLHGPGWQRKAGTPVGRRPMHLLATVAGLVAVAAALSRRRRPAAAGAVVWAALTTEFAGRRILAGPRFGREVATMLVTSAAIPPAATWHWATGMWRHRRAAAWPLPIKGLLVDRDGTLVRDVPYNGDPRVVETLPGVAEALDQARAAGLRIGVVTNQSGIARGLLTAQQVGAVNAKVDALLGPFAAWCVCPHDTDDACGCRKPEPGMVLEAARALRLAPYECAFIGDTGADTAAARAGGASLAVLVPNEVTRREEVQAAELSCDTFAEATRHILERA